MLVSGAYRTMVIHPFAGISFVDTHHNHPISSPKVVYPGSWWPELDCIQVYSVQWLTDGSALVLVYFSQYPLCARSCHIPFEWSWSKQLDSRSSAAQPDRRMLTKYFLKTLVLVLSSKAPIPLQKQRVHLRFPTLSLVACYDIAVRAIFTPSANVISGVHL